MDTWTIAFIVGSIALFIGVLFGGALAGFIAYREGVDDAKRNWFIHAKCWHHHKEEFE